MHEQKRSAFHTVIGVTFNILYMNTAEKCVGYGYLDILVAGRSCLSQNELILMLLCHYNLHIYPNTKDTSRNLWKIINFCIFNTTYIAYK